MVYFMTVFAQIIMSHFWVMFERHAWKDVIESLEKQNKIKEFKAITNKEQEIETISQAVQHECLLVDGFDIEDNDDEDGSYILHVRSKGDCGVDVVRIIIMFYEELQKVDF